MKDKFYSMHHVCVDKSGNSHVVTVVGKFSQKRDREYVEEEHPIMVGKQTFPGAVSYFKRVMTRKLTIGMSICHPLDDFDKTVGEEIAKRRIKQGDDVGTLYTHDVTMLTKDQIVSHLQCKLKYICDHIDDYMERMSNVKKH